MFWIVLVNAAVAADMSLADKAARGALWTVVSSIGGRVIGVLGTLVMTRFLHPSQIGEVNDAAILAMTANWFTIWGFGQYSVVKGRGADTVEVTWHAVVAYAVLGTISLGLVALNGAIRPPSSATRPLMRRPTSPAWRSPCTSAATARSPSAC